uniref:Reverse transcriptase domain-containing protein n=1 Tax=Heliothis virescens TaxID=7102 RepID=A0A2A4JYZ1_HELVI
MINNLTTDLDNFSVSEARACDVEDCKQYLSSYINPFTILTQNIRSIFKNFDNFNTLHQRLNINCDIIVLTECWLTKNYNIPLIPGYSAYKTNINRSQNEGVIVYAKNHLTVSIEEPTMLDCNRLLVKIGTDVAILAIYRPPSFRIMNNFIESLNSTLQNLSSFKNIILIGDININILPENADSAAQEYLNLCAFHGLLPAHTLPTHQSGSCLDHIMLKSKFRSLTLVANSTITDHHAALLTLNCKLPKPNTRTITKLNVNKLEEDLRNIDYDPVYNSADPQISMTYLIQKIQHAIQQNTTKHKLTNKNYNLKPWITPGLIRCMRHRDKLHMKAKSNPENSILQLSYKRYRNFCNDLLRKIKCNYDKNVINNAGTNSKLIWDHIKKVTYISKQNESSSSLLKVHTSHLEAANLVNNYFIKVGKCLADKIPRQSQCLASIPFINNTTSTSFGLIDTDETEVEQIIMNLKDDCAVGWDNISNKTIKQFRHILVPPLTYIFRTCLSKSHFPQCLKKAVVIPVHKSGSKEQVTNYRPISLLPTISKILEKIINKRLMKYLEKQSILSVRQFGFRPKLSTADAVHLLTNYIAQELDKGNHTIGIFLDLAKAFDTISIPILLRKLEAIGVRGDQLKLFKSYLEDRSQCVKIGDVLSCDENNTSFGVPQGSILGPTLFLIYINDLCNLKLDHATIISYADDTALLFSADSEKDVYRLAQHGFNVVNNWLSNNSLTLNADKTNYIKFSMRKLTSIGTYSSLYAHHCSHAINNKCTCPSIKLTNKIKYLGVILDETLSFKHHIESLNNRLRKLIFVFKKVRYIADSKILRQVYFALCQSLITYCITTWGGAGKTLLLTIERAQRAVLKISTFRPFLYPTNLLYKHCEVLTVRQLFIMNIVLKQHTSLPYNTQHLNKRRKDRVCPQNMVLKHAFISKFYVFLGPLLYNRLNEIANIYSMNYHNCKMALKQALQSMSYEDTEKLLIVLE